MLRGFSVLRLADTASQDMLLVAPLTATWALFKVSERRST
jgi:hypothetical protein